MEDVNTEVRKKQDGEIVDKYELGSCNERGENGIQTIK